MYRIRRAMDRNDVLHLADIDRRSFEKPMTVEQWEQQIRNNLVLVNTHWGTPVGYLIAKFNQIEAIITRFAVKPQHRRNGLASALISQVVRDNFDKYVTCTIAESQVLADGGALGKFMNKLQFQAQLPILKEHFEEEDAICFVLENAVNLSRKAPRSTHKP